MRYLLICVVAMGVALAGGYAEYEKAFLEQDPGLIAARSEVEAAEQRVAALADDPYASPYERQVAADGLTRARAMLKKRLADLRQQAFRRYAAVITARAQLERARAWEKQTAIAYEAAKIKAEEGAIAAYEVEKARIAWEDARLATARARSQLREAEAVLTRYGEVEAEEIPSFPLPAPLAVKAHPDYVLAGLDVRKAERAYRAGMGPDTSEQQRAWLKARLEAARNRLVSLEASLGSELDLRRREVDAAAESLELKNAALTSRQQAYEAARLRYQKGLISELMLRQAEFALRSAQLEEVRAKVALEIAKLALLPFQEGN